MTHRVALVTGVYHGGEEGGAAARLRDVLAEARHAGAAIAVLPELPLDPWVPVRAEPRERDAEPPGGPRHRALSEAAAGEGVALVGGAIVCDPSTGRRANTALVFGPDGRLLARHRKIHVPDEEGFREAAHYEPGDEPPEPFDLAGLRAGIQICSDVQRLTGAQLLAAAHAELIVVPRATPPGTWERWKLTLRAAAVAAAAWVVSVNRPAEPGSPVGGPSVAVDPWGRVVVETLDELALVDVDAEAARAARADYPGYLSYAPAVMAEGWARLSGRGRA